MNNLAHLLLIPLKKITEKENMRANNFIRQSAKSKPLLSGQVITSTRSSVSKLITVCKQTSNEKVWGHWNLNAFWDPEGTDVITPCPEHLKEHLSNGQPESNSVFLSS